MDEDALLLFTFAALFAVGIAIWSNVGQAWAEEDFRDRLAEALGDE